METVIAIPLFITLIGGIMWIGQLIYGKQKLVIADRYVAWNYGNNQRRGTPYDDAPGRFFDKDQYGENEVQKQEGIWEQSQWWHSVYGAVNLTVTMPSWTRGWLATDSIMKGRSFLLDEKTPPYYGRLDPSGKNAGGHWVVMQRLKEPDDTRALELNRDTDPLGVNYQGIFEESYPAERSGK